MWRHFRSKADLLVAAVLHAEAGLAPPDPAAPQPKRTPAAQVDAAVAHLWAYARSAAFQALIELLRVSRSDPELRAALVARDSDAAETFFDACSRLLGPALAGHPTFRYNTRMLGLALYGTALTDGLRSERQDALLLGELKQLGRQLFDCSTSESARGSGTGHPTSADH